MDCFVANAPRNDGERLLAMTRGEVYGLPRLTARNDGEKGSAMQNEG